jgi:hypothetical protein
MDKKIQILLGSQKNTNSVNVDTYDKVELFNNTSELMEYDVNDAVSETEIFNIEREENAIYRRIEYMSLLNGLINNYTEFKDFLTPRFNGNSKTIENSFEFYLVKPSAQHSSSIFVRHFEVIATPNDFELFPVGFSNNVYGEQTYAFNFKRDFDISTYFESFNSLNTEQNYLIPITELFLYAKYIPSVTEVLKYTNWDTSLTPIQTLLNTTPLVIGSTVYGDLINYNIPEFLQTPVSEQTYYISTTCSDVSVLRWKYNPFISFKLRYFSNELDSANTGSTSYDIITTIPEYAIPIDNKGNLVWRDILPQGYVDPLTGIGVDYPFVNKRRYLFSRIILSIVPDMTEPHTKEIFNNIWFSKNASSLNITPMTNLGNIGAPCQ